MPCRDACVTGQQTTICRWLASGCNPPSTVTAAYGPIQASLLTGVSRAISPPNRTQNDKSSRQTTSTKHRTLSVSKRTSNKYFASSHLLCSYALLPSFTFAFISFLYFLFLRSPLERCEANCNTVIAFDAVLFLINSPQITCYYSKYY